MSTNCLVTKVKGSVNNDNLPIFGKVKFLIEHVDDAVDYDKLFVIVNGSSPCKVTFVNTTPLDSAFAGQTEVTLAANETIVCHIDLSGNNISIIADAYSIRGFEQRHITDIIDYNSLKYGELITGSYSNNTKDIKKKMAEIFNTKTGIKCLSEIPVSDETIVRNADTLMGCFNYINPILVKDATNLLVCKIDDGCNIEYLPATIKCIDLVSTAIGSLTNLVNKFRTAGRTSGKIYVSWITANKGCTIDNGSGTEIPIREYVEAHGLPEQSEGYLYWTADTVGITVDGTDAETYSTTWYQAPYV